MKFRHLASIIIIGCLFLQGCNLEPDIAPVPTFDGEANMTIAELLSLHECGDLDSYDTIPAGTIITGIVTTSDEWGNNYKSINIEDGTAGIQIKINSTALYNKYKVGQRVYVKCDGLHIGDYRKLHQLGMWVNGSMQAIPSNKAYKYIFIDGTPQPVSPTIVFTSIPGANDIPTEYYNRLVRLEGASFVEGGIATFSEPNAATSHDIKMTDGSTITLRTSNYAKFAGTTLPVGVGNITGILTRYNSTVQLVISSLDDLENFSVPQTMQTIYSVSDYTTAFDNGWTQSGTGNEWYTLSNSSFSGFSINPSEVQDKWLISPAINMSGVQEPTLNFTHRAPKTFFPEKMRCYYTTNYTGDPTTTQWTQIDLSQYSGSTAQSDVSVALPAEAASPTFRMAFRHDCDKSSWYISNIAIKGLSK